VRNQAAKPKSLKCAIYTRKSSEEGLEQDFNSLHAQRESCEAYIKSQKHEGYVVIPRNDGEWNPHASYHRDGTFHSKSFNHKMSSSKRQPLTEAFKGCEPLGMNAGHGPKTVHHVGDQSCHLRPVSKINEAVIGPATI
jgi:hypothetical protein